VISQPDAVTDVILTALKSVTRGPTFSGTGGAHEFNPPAALDPQLISTAAAPEPSPRRVDADYGWAMRSLVTDILEGVYQELVGNCRGAVANYIPELEVVDPDSFAICLSTCDGRN
jgi:hypothetical protein